MYMLRQRITSKTALTGTPTWRYKLPSVGKYTAFELVVDCNRFADRADNSVCYPIESQISKIELVEGGSRAIISLPGSQLDALNYWENGKPNARRHSNQAASDNLLHLYLMGGRSLYDTKYGFDLEKLAETYLEYTHLFAADAAEKFDVSAHIVYLYGWRWMGPGEPDFSGYFRSRQLASWTTAAADTIHTVEIPVGNPYRIFGIQSKSAGTTLGGAISKAELMVNNGQYSPVTIQSMMQYCMQEIAQYDLHNSVEGQEYSVGTAANVLPEWWSYGGECSAVQKNGAADIALTADGWVNPMIATAITTGNIPFAFKQTGYGFQKCARIGFDVLEDGGDLLHSVGMGALDLEITEAAADKAVAVFAQDVVAY